MTSSFSFTASDGAKLAVTIEGTGPTLVMLHGWAMGAAYFDTVRGALARHFRLILPDFRGHGESGPCAYGQRMARYAADIREIIAAHHDGGPLFYLGWSMGASVIFALLDLFPDVRPSAVMIVDQSPCNTVKPDWPYGAFGMTRNGIDGLEQTLRSDFSGFIANFIPGMFARPPDNAALARLTQTSMKIAPDAAADILVDHINQDWRDVVRRLTIPTMAIAAGRFVLKDADIMFAGLNPAIEVVTFSESGHCPFIEEPDRFAETVCDFLGQTHQRPVRPRLRFNQPLGAVMLIAFVVADLDQAVKKWSQTTGIGPWYVSDAPVGDGLIFRGQPNHGAMRIALAASGSLAISLIEPKDDAPSLHREIAAQRGWNSLTHVAASTRSYDQDAARLHAMGYPTVLEGKAAGIGGQRFAYFDTADDLGPIYELIEVDANVETLFARLAAAAARWDGARAMRPMAELPQI